MQKSIFDAAVERQRYSLRARGWREECGLIRYHPVWRRPDGALVDEPEAFKQLERLLKEEGPDVES